MTPERNRAPRHADIHPDDWADLDDDYLRIFNERPPDLADESKVIRLV